MVSAILAKYQLTSSILASVKATKVMAESGSQYTFQFKRFLGFDLGHSSLLSRLLLYSCYCTWYALIPTVSALDARTTRTRPMDSLTSRTLPLAFLDSTSSRARSPMFGSNGKSSTTNSPFSTRLFSSSSQNENLSVKSLAHKLADSEYSKIVVLVGAGASCSAGIPDFRTPGTGLYDKLGKYNLPVPEAIFDLDYYTKVTPLPFVDLCQDIWPGQEDGPKPTPTHHFLKLLEEKQLLHRIYTQNIDGLEALAGISTDRLVECHGHFRSSSCTNCKTTIPIEECQKTIVEEGMPPKCPRCGSLVKPDIVFFGEEMPSRFMELIDKDVEDCDLLLVFGTSLLVMPVAGIPSWVGKDCPRILFNREPAGGIGSGISKHLRQDLFLQGDCDDSVKSLCDLTGWKRDLEALIARN